MEEGCDGGESVSAGVLAGGLGGVCVSEVHYYYIWEIYSLL